MIFLIETATVEQALQWRAARGTRHLPNEPNSEQVKQAATSSFEAT